MKCACLWNSLHFYWLSSKIVEIVEIYYEPVGTPTTNEVCSEVMQTPSLKPQTWPRSQIPLARGFHFLATQLFSQ